MEFSTERHPPVLLSDPGLRCLREIVVHGQSIHQSLVSIVNQSLSPPALAAAAALATAAAPAAAATTTTVAANHESA